MFDTFINLPNRYRGVSNCLKLVDSEHDFATYEMVYSGQEANYARYGFSDTDMRNYDFVDPSGGPFIQVGSFKLKNGYVLKRLHVNSATGKLWLDFGPANIK